MRSVQHVGFWSALLAFIFTLAYVVVQLLQVARVIHFPWDEALIYGTSLGIVIPFTLGILALHYSVPAEKRFWTHGALIFTSLYAVFVTANYIVQLTTVLPAKINGTIRDISILDQTPHSMFWDFDAIGYIFMGIAMFIAVPAFKKTGIDKYTRLAFLANGLVTPLITVVYFYPVYSERLLILGYPWGITAPFAMLMLALYLRRHQSIITS
jgi:hypothetical protein